MVIISLFYGIVIIIFVLITKSDKSLSRHRLGETGLKPSRLSLFSFLLLIHKQNEILIIKILFRKAETKIIFRSLSGAKLAASRNFCRPQQSPPGESKLLIFE